MKNVDDLEKLWRQQTVAAPADARKVRVAQVAVERDANRYGRLLKWSLFFGGFCLVLGTVLAVVNYVHAGRAPTWLELLQHAVAVAFQAGVLIAVLRRLRVHQGLLRQSAASVRENVAVALALVEREMLAYRIDGRLLPAFAALVSLPLVGNFAAGHFDAPGLLGRLGFVVGLCALFGLVGLRHYRSVLRPQRQRLTELLRELDQG